jgi:fatty-acid desaturase
MRYLLKGIIWLVILSVGLLLGIKLLPGFVWWQIILFIIACYAIGHISYKLFRLIDKRFSS